MIMRAFTVLIWSMLISMIVSYVLTSMAGVPLNLNHTMILGTIFTIGVLLIGSMDPKEEKS